MAVVAPVQLLGMLAVIRHETAASATVVFGA